MDRRHLVEGGSYGPGSEQRGIQLSENLPSYV